MTMRNDTPATSRRQRGFTLAEVTVATAVLVVVIVGALMLYDRGNRVFKESNESAEMQQNARIAYDRMIADLRMAGFDYMRGGAIPAASVPTPWVANRQYAAGTVVTPVVPNGNIYRCMSNGTSGGVEPAWPSGSTTVNDNTTTWVKSGGIPSQQPDEQIEYINSAAITVRANYDYSQQQAGDGDHGRETALESTQFPIVTTGNDEIVTYALVSSNAAANTQSVQFFADINSSGTPTRRSYAGGTAERQITIPNVDLTNNNPPYTLNRYTLSPTGEVVTTALAENIRSLNFFYYSDTAGRTPLLDNNGAYTPNTILGLGQFNPNTANTPILQRLYRGRIRSIRVRLVGMNEIPDAKYQDTDTINGIVTTDATVTGTAAVPVVDTVSGTYGPNACANCTMKNYRKMSIDTLVVPRNLGLRGMIQTEDQPPTAPTITSVCVGFCGVAVVTWNTNTNQQNANYVVTYDTNANGSFSGSSASTIGTSIAVDLTQQDRSATYSFRVRAYNSAGSALSNVVTASIQNGTTPGPVTSIVASGGSGSPVSGLAGKVRLTFTAPTTYTGTGASCTPNGTPPATPFMREVKGFRIYRGTSAGFTADASSQIVDENASGTSAPANDGYGNYTYDDNTVANCGNYYYRVQAVEWCAAAAAENIANNVSTALGAITPANGSNAINGAPSTSGTPQVPPNVTIDAPNSSCSVSLNTCSIRVTWSKVTQDTNNNPVTVGTYEVEREQWLPGAPTPVATTTATVSGAVAGSTVTYNDTTAQEHAVSSVKYYYKYRVRAMQVSPCAPSGWSAQVQYPPPCTFSGSVIVETGATTGDGLTAGTAWSMNAGDTFQVTPPGGQSFTQVTMDVFNGNTAVASYTTTSSPASFSWQDQTPGTTYRILFTMTNNASPPCTQQLTRYVVQETPPGCTLNTLGAPTNDATVLTLAATPAYTLKLKLVNTASEAINLTSMDFTWTQPSRIAWDRITFPSGGFITLTGATTPATFTQTLNPRPVTLAASDVTVPANSTIILTLNFSKTNGNPSMTANTISNVCVKYTRASVIGQTFLCRIVPGAGAGNPFTSCN
jgi:prepilin-type N-terminal cleavage/methylation domain-containing protein